MVVVMVIEDSGGGGDGDLGPESTPEGNLSTSMLLQFMKNCVTLVKFV